MASSGSTATILIVKDYANLLSAPEYHRVGRWGPLQDQAVRAIASELWGKIPTVACFILYEVVPLLMLIHCTTLIPCMIRTPAFNNKNVYVEKGVRRQSPGK